MPRHPSGLANEIRLQDGSEDGSESEGEHSLSAVGNELGAFIGKARMSERYPGSDSDESGSGDDYEPPAEDGGDDEDMEADEEERPERRTRREEEEDVDAAEDARGDEVFNRLAGFVSRQSQSSTDPQGARYFADSLLLSADNDTAEDHGASSSRPRRLRKEHKPSHEVSKLIGQANLANINDGALAAVNLYLEVIRLDPYVFSAWNSLASCYDELGNSEAARQMRFCGAHVGNDADAWRELAVEYKELGQTTQYTYCLRKALKIEPKDVEGLYELASMYREQGRLTNAADTVRRILRYDPQSSHDLDFLSDNMGVFTTLIQLNVIRKAFRTAIDWNIATFESPQDTATTASGEVCTLGLDHIVSLVDMYARVDNLEDALLILRRGQRWLSGRKSEFWWDGREDDKEYDPPNYSREPEGGDEPEDEGEKGRHPLETVLRHRLAIIRLKMGQDEEAAIHIDEILQLDVVQHQEVIRELGDDLFKRQMWTQALDCYAALQEEETVDDDATLIYHVGTCHYHMKDYSQAIEALRWVVGVDPKHNDAKLRLAACLEDTGQKSEALELITEVLRARAAELPQRAGKPRRNPAEGPSLRMGKRAFEEQMREQMEQLWNNVCAAEEGIDAGDLGALDTFIQAAGTMIENYRMAKSNFTKSRGITRVGTGKTSKLGKRGDLDGQLLDMQDRLERTMGLEDEEYMEPEEQERRFKLVRQTEWYGLTNEQWLNLIVKYCCVLMVKGEEDVALDILEHVVWSGLFFNRRSEIALRMTILACAMRQRSWLIVVDNCRRLAQLHQFRAEPFLLMMACLGTGGVAAHRAWNGRELQKFLHRELRIWDDAVQGRKLHYSGRGGRWGPVNKIGLSRALGDDLGYSEDEAAADKEDGFQRGEVVGGEGGGRIAQGADERTDAGDEEDAGGGWNVKPKLPKNNSAEYNVLYGMYMLDGRSWQSAMFYFFRAYEANPYDPLICLLCAQSLFGRAGVRQVDNRNFMITQGLAFLTKYREHSPKDAQGQEEVEYNFGRAFHGLGVPHLAMKHYETVLALVKQRMAASEFPEDVKRSSLACEAAHNLVLLYSASGNMGMVQEKSKWLAI